MKIITSKDNAIYKKTLRLTRKKYRDREGKYLMEGVKPLKDASEAGILPETVFICEGTGEIPECRDMDMAVLGRHLFENISSTETSQGVIAVVRKRVYSEERFIRAVGNGNVLIMDRLQDPGNIGTIIRTAEAAGYRGIVMMHGSGDVYSPKVVRAAAGSLMRMPVISVSGAQETAGLMKKMGKRIAVTSMDAGRSCFETDLRSDIALVIGNEGNGVSEGFMENADINIKIPMQGSIESLNAAVAAGILMFQSQVK